jgi:cytochrome P450
MPEARTVIPLDRPTCPFDPDPEYRRLREEEPISPVKFDISPGPTDGWLVTRHADIRAIMTDDRFSHRAELLALPATPPFDVESYDPVPSPPGSFVRMDAPDHTHYRRLLTGFFTVRKIEEYEPTLAGIIDECLDELAALERPVDLLSQFVRKVVYRSVNSVLGVPAEDIAELDEHFSVIMRIDYSLDEFIHHNAALDATLARVVKNLFENPNDKLLGKLIATGELTREELTNIAWITVGGALDTTPNMMSLGAWSFIEHPEELAKVKANPELWERAVEEQLRYLTISHMGASRVALEDVEIGGVTIKKGQTVVLSLPAANRDPEQFEDPETFDVTRPSRRHMAFGFGIHQCLGQHLARATLRIGWQKLFDRFPDLRLAVAPEDVPLRSKAMHYGVYELPVTWG